MRFNRLSHKAREAFTEGYNDGFWGRVEASDSVFYLQGYTEGKAKSLGESA